MTREKQRRKWKGSEVDDALDVGGNDDYGSWLRLMEADPAKPYAKVKRLSRTVAFIPIHPNSECREGLKVHLRQVHAVARSLRPTHLCPANRGAGCRLRSKK